MYSYTVSFIDTLLTQPMDPCGEMYEEFLQEFLSYEGRLIMGNITHDELEAFHSKHSRYCEISSAIRRLNVHSVDKSIGNVQSAIGDRIEEDRFICNNREKIAFCVKCLHKLLEDVQCTYVQVNYMLDLFYMACNEI